MQNFFTPVQVIREHAHCYSSEDLRRFNESLLFQITPPRVPSLADERKNVIHWLRSLPISYRQQAAALHSPELAALARRLYQDGQGFADAMRYGFEMNGGEFRVLRERHYKQSRERQKALLQEVRLISLGKLFQALTLAESALADPDALFENFEQVLGGVLLDGSHFNEEELKTGRVSFEEEVLGSEPKTLGVWIAQLLLKQILLSFKTNSAEISAVCKHMKQQEQQYSKFWREISPSNRLQLVEKGFSRPPQELMAEYRNSVCVSLGELPKLYITQSIEEVKREYVQINSKDIFERLVFSNLQQSLNLYEIFKIQLAMEIEAYLTALKTGTIKKQKKKKKKNTDRTDRILPATPPIISQRNIQKQQQIQNTQYIVDKKQQQTLIIAQQPIISPTHSQSPAKILSTSAQESQLQSPLPSNSKKIMAQQKTLPSNSILDDFTRRLKQKNNDKHRKIILNRITFILSQLNLACRPFGSYAVHLSLADSDLDIQVDSSLLGYFYLDYLSQRKQVITALEFLRKILEPHQWISGFQLFYNARIPLLTFKADAGMHFPNPTNQKTKLKLNGKAVPNGEAVIQVDLSIQPYANMTELPHNGLQATELIRQWLQTMPILEKLVLGLKAVVKNANLHKSYEGKNGHIIGGLSSYCLVLLSVAFLKLNSPEGHTDIVFKELVKFIRRFHNQKLVVDVGSEHVIREAQGIGPVLVSPWDGRNLVERAFRFADILEALQSWQQALHK